jgi:hypothetical protein
VTEIKREEISFLKNAIIYILVFGVGIFLTGVALALWAFAAFGFIIFVAANFFIEIKNRKKKNER